MPFGPLGTVADTATKQNLGERYGPFPAWAWIGIAAGSALLYVWWKGRQAAPTPTPTPRYRASGPAIVPSFLPAGAHRPKRKRAA